VTKHSTDILVVGGGIIGMLTARELAMAGAHVTLVERQECGRESSWAGGGIVSPLYPWRYSDAVTALAGWGQQRYAELAAALQQESGIDPEWVRSGLLMLDVAEDVEALAWADAHGKQMEQLAGPGLRSLEPALAVGESGLWMSQIGQVRNPRLAQAARAALATHGIEVREHTEVSGLDIRDGRIHGVQTEHGAIEASRVVIAGGAWSAQLLQELAVGVEVEPVKGQMILYRIEPGAIRHIVLNQGKYLIPRRDGHVLAGSTLEYVGFDKRSTQEALQELQQVAETMFPLLADSPVVKQWAGLRPGSPSGIPYIGEHPQVAGLFVNAGHFRNGVVLGPASARLMADLVLEREPILDPDPYGLEAPH
jgi:glycine oxidase